MKLIFLVTLFFLASDWPTPSVCWPSLNQQYGAMDSTPLSAILGQQMLSNQLNSYGMNTLMGNGAGRFNPDLMKMFSSGGNGGIEPRGAFARVGNQAKAKKLSNTKFMLKPVNPVVMHDEPIEEAVEEFEQEFVPARGQRQFQQQQPRKLVKRPFVAESPRKANFQRQQQLQQQQQQVEEEFEEQHLQEDEQAIDIDNLHQLNEEQQAELENVQQTVEQNVAPPVLQEQAAVVAPVAPAATAPLAFAPAIAPATAAVVSSPETANVAAQNVDQTSSSQQVVVEDQLVSKIQQHQQQQELQQEQQQVEATPNAVVVVDADADAAAPLQLQQETETSADADHPSVKAVQQQQDIPEVHAPAHATYTAPFAQKLASSSSSTVSTGSSPAAASSESVRMLNARIPSRNINNFQQQLTQQQAYDQYFDEEAQQQQQQPLVQQQQQQAQVRPLRFKVETPDNINSVGLETIRSEMSRELSQRRNPNRMVSTADDDDDEQPNFNQRESTRPLYANSYFNPNANTGFGDPTTADFQRTKFSSLIIIVNSNDNTNLGVAYIDPDFLRSFLSQYAGRSVNDVLSDSSLEDKVKKFNREHERTSSTSKTNGKENKSSSDKSSDSGYGSKKSESTSKLSANIPTYTGAASEDSHSESTVLLRRQDGGYANQNAGSSYNPNTYSYVPYESGGLIIINNVNRNWNKRVRSVLSGEEKNTSRHNEAFALPLPKKEIKHLMRKAIILSNDNSNKNLN